MYEAAHAVPEGASTAARLASTAATCGFEGLVVRNADAVEADLGAVTERYGLDLVAGIEIRADDPQSASGHVGAARSEYEIVAVRGGTPALNRFAVESPRVDVLAAPLRAEGDVNHVLAKAAAENSVHLEFDFGPVLRSDGGQRVRALQGLRKLREIVTYYDAPFVVSARAADHLQLRAPRELVAIGEQIGFDAETVRDGLAAWGELAERNRERHSEAFVAPGVRVTDSERDGPDECDSSPEGER